MKDIEKFCNVAIIILIEDIIEIDMIIPRLVFDYSMNTNITNGYYMSKNVVGDIITLNMNHIMELKYEDDIKTVIIYGFIHEILHNFQFINSKYFKDPEYNNTIEDITDYDTIAFVKDYINLIEKRLKFKFNTVFLTGIEKQLNLNRINKRSELGFDSTYTMDPDVHITNLIAGALSGKLNINYDFIQYLVFDSECLKFIFPDGREYYISPVYDTANNVYTLVNLIYITDFKFIYYRFTDNYIELRLY